MTLLSKTVIAMVAALTSLFILKPLPAPTAQDLAPRHAEIFEGYASPVIPTTTLKTALIGCDAVFEMARYVGWDESQLTTLIAVAQRESRCQPDAFNKADTVGQSYGVLQVNDFWCKPSRYYKQGYMQALALLDTCQDLFDLETNLRAGLAIYRYSNGWRAWGGK